METSCGGGASDELSELHQVGGEGKRGTQLLFPQLSCCDAYFTSNHKKDLQSTGDGR